LIERVSERAPRPRAPHSDPFFDQPYEPSGDGAAAWESTRSSTAGAAMPARVLPANIRPKKKVASLLGGSSTV